MFAAIKIPQAYLTMGEDGAEDKTTLAQKDIRFARTIQRLQRVIISELTKVGIIHLYTLGFRNDDLLSFSLTLNNPSKIAELQELEHWKTKFDTAGGATEGYFSRRWVAEHVFNMSHEEFLRCQREMFYDRKYDAALQAAAEGEQAGAGGAGLEAELGADLGGELDAGGPIEAPAEDIAPDELGGDDDSALLAVPPGSRNAPTLKPSNKEGYLTPGSKGKRHKQEPFDSRGGGARHRHQLSLGGNSVGKNTLTNVFPGAKELRTLARGITEGIYENDQSTYKVRERVEEEKLFDVNNSIRTLIEGLEKKQTILVEKVDEEAT